MKDAFLCHAAEDKPAVRSVALGLERYGISTWLDEAEMLPGDILVEKLAEAIQHARWFCVFLTPNSVAKNWVKFELAQAMNREVTSGSAFVLPVILFDCNLPPFLNHKIYVDLRNWDSYDAALDQLARRIKGDLVAVPPNFKMMRHIGPEASEEEILSLPPAQAALEFKLRFERWTSRRLQTLRSATSLTLKQVITYCEESPYIILHPVVKASKDIFYGARWRVLAKFPGEAEYRKQMEHYLIFLTNEGASPYPDDVLKYFLSFRGENAF